MDDKFRLFAEACRAGDLEALASLLEMEPSLPQARDEEGHSLLGLACKAVTGDVGQYAVVDFLLQAGADPAAASHEGWAPLHSAARRGNLELAKRLLAAGAPRQGRLLGCQGGSPLSLALFYAQTEVAELLAEPPVPDNLRTAASLGRSVEVFCRGDGLTPEASYGLDFYRPTSAFPVWERTYSRQEILDEALSWAARNDQPGSLLSIVELGGNVNANPYRGTPLLWAIYADKVSAATWLLDHGANPDLRHDFGGDGHGCGAVALHLAAQYDSVECLKLLLARGADTTLKDAAFGGTPLGWARHAGAKTAIKLLS